MKKAKTALFALLAVCILAAAAAVVVVPIYKQKEQQNREVLGQAEAQTFETAEQNEKMQQNALAKSLYQNKQHILLAGEPDTQTGYTQPAKTSQEIFEALQPCYEQITADTPLPSMPAILQQEEAVMAGSRLNCPYYGIHDANYDTWYYAAWDQDTGMLTYLNSYQQVALGEAAELIEKIDSQKLAAQLAAQYLQMLGLAPEEFSAPEPMEAINALMDEDYSDKLDRCLLYSSDYELYVYCTLRASSDETMLYLNEYIGVCSLTPEEMRKAVE